MIQFISRPNDDEPTKSALFRSEFGLPGKTPADFERNVIKRIEELIHQDGWSYLEFLKQIRLSREVHTIEGTRLFAFPLSQKDLSAKAGSQLEIRFDAKPPFHPEDKAKVTVTTIPQEENSAHDIWKDKVQAKLSGFQFARNEERNESRQELIFKNRNPQSLGVYMSSFVNSDPLWVVGSTVGIPEAPRH